MMQRPIEVKSNHNSFEKASEFWKTAKCVLHEIYFMYGPAQNMEVTNVGGEG